MYKFYYIKIDDGFVSTSLYSAYYSTDTIDEETAVVNNMFALLYPSNINAINLTFNDLAYGNGIKVKIPDSAINVFLVNQNTNTICPIVSLEPIITQTPTPTLPLTPPVTQTPTQTPPVTRSPTRTPTQTATATVTPTQTITPTVTPGLSPSPTRTPISTPTSSNTEDCVFDFTVTETTLPDCDIGGDTIVTDTNTSINGTVTVDTYGREFIITAFGGNYGEENESLVTLLLTNGVTSYVKNVYVNFGDVNTDILTVPTIGTFTYTLTLTEFGTTGGSYGNFQCGELIPLPTPLPTPTMTITPTRSTEISCTEGMDIVFVVDYTNSMGVVINNIKNNVTSIANAISSTSSDNYRLGLAIFDEMKIISGLPNYYYSSAYQSLPSNQKYINTNNTDGVTQYITAMEMFSQNNVDTFNQQINLINNLEFPLGRGVNAPEPSDVAVDLIINSDFVGSFRSGVKKIIILITDNLPSGNDDKHNVVDDLRVAVLRQECVNKGIKVILMTSYQLNVLYLLANGSGGFVVNGYSPTEIINAINNICN